MKLRLLLLGLCLLMLSACYRSATRELTLSLPDTRGNSAELDAIKRYLLSEQDQLRDGLTLYESIRIHPESSALEITYSRQYLADRNLIHKVNGLGYQVRDLSGDPAKRNAFRKHMNLP